jgi:hypothetical protein
LTVRATRNALFCKRALIVAGPGTTSFGEAAGSQSMEAMEVAVSITFKLQKIAIAAGTAVGLGAISCSAGEPPQYEAAGFPITPHQLTVLGLGNIQEQSPPATLTLNGMPASPHQIAVLQPQWRVAPLDKMIIDLAEEIEINTTQPTIGTRANLIERLARAKAQWAERYNNHSETN